MADQEQATLRDTLSEAFAEAETPIDTPAANAVGDSRTRDDSGKFARTEKTEEAPVEAVEKVERPSTWKKDYWEKYDKLEPDLRKYILQRENEYKSGLSTYNAEVKASQSLKSALDPFMPDLQRNNIDPANFVKNLATAHHMLATGDPRTKAQMFMRMANDYGVDLRQLVSGQPQAPEISYLAQNLQGLQREIQQFKSQQEAAENANIAANIEEFKSDAKQHPFFEEARPTMAQLLTSGMAQDLKEAYEKAIYMVPELREKVLAAQQQASRTSQLEQQAAVARKARANAVSPRSANPGVAPVVAGKKGLRDSLADAFSELAPSRV